MDIGQLPGLTPEAVSHLHEAGVRTVQQLLQVSRGGSRFLDLAAVTRLPPETLLSLLDRAKLSRLRGVGPRNLAHLLAAGVGSLEGLAAQEPAPLRARLRQVTPHPPNLAVIEHWILQARRQT